MTREQLAALGATKVRKDKALFSLFKQYITEDAALIYSSGKLPTGCFSCQFPTHFNRWSGFIKKKDDTMSTKKTYELADNRYRVYFNGGILDNSSDDDQWVAWIKYKQSKYSVDRKAKFKTLPEAIRPKKKKTDE